MIRRFGSVFYVEVSWVFFLLYLFIFVYCIDSALLCGPCVQNGKKINFLL